MSRTHCILIAVLALYCFTSEAQTRIGLTLNVGDRQHFSANSKAFALALAPSGSLSVSSAEELADRWFFQYGITGGVVPYNLRVGTIDTFLVVPDILPFPDYSTIFASADLMLGPKFLVQNRYLSIGAGVGMTAYVSVVQNSSYSVSVANNDNTSTTLFEASMSAPANRFSGFWKIAALYDVSDRVSIGIEYVNHARPAARGYYQFYHTRTPVFGTIEIYQREFRIGAFYRLKKV